MNIIRHRCDFSVRLSRWHTDTDVASVNIGIHECLNGRAPPYLSEHCIPVSSADTRRHLRSANRHLLGVPRFRLNTYGRRAFSVAGPMAWNSLPDFIRDPTSSTDCFRRLLKMYTRFLTLMRYANPRTHAFTHSLYLEKGQLPHSLAEYHIDD